MSRAVAPKTLSNYGTGLLCFMRFCDDLNVPEELQMPAPEWLLSSFLTTRGAGAVSKGMMVSWLQGLELWHAINNARWNGGSHLKRALQGSLSAAPPSSTKPRRKAVTIPHLKSLRKHLTLTNTFDAAVFATACVAFWGQCGLGEITVNGPFHPLKHASRSSQRKICSTASGVKFGGFWAPVTKTAACGQEILWTDSHCPCSAVWAFQNHLTINSSVPANAHLFAFKTESGSHAPMTRKWFLERCNKIWALDHLDNLSGHSFRIGGTTHLLLLGINPFVVMMQGRWRSNAFLEYWRHCKELLLTTIIGLSLNSRVSILSSMSAFKSKLLGR